MNNFVLFPEARRMVAAETSNEPKCFEFGDARYSYVGMVIHFNHLVDSNNRVLGFEIVAPIYEEVKQVLQRLAGEAINVRTEYDEFQIFLTDKVEEVETDCCMSIGGAVYVAGSKPEPIIVLPDSIEWAHKVIGFELQRKNVPIGRD